MLALALVQPPKPVDPSKAVGVEGANPFACSLVDRGCTELTSVGGEGGMGILGGQIVEWGTLPAGRGSSESRTPTLMSVSSVSFFRDLVCVVQRAVPLVQWRAVRRLCHWCVQSAVRKLAELATADYHGFALAGHQRDRKAVLLGCEQLRQAWTSN